MNIKDFETLGINVPEKGKFIIVLCSKWCRSCKLLSTVLGQFRDEGFFKLEEIDIAEYSKLALELKINAIPALIFIKDGKLLEKDIEINGEKLIKKGVMIGAFNETILTEIIKKL